MLGEDCYYAIYDPGLGQHTIIALTDPTISASNASDGKLWSNDSTNGTGELWTLFCDGDDNCSYECAQEAAG